MVSILSPEESEENYKRTFESTKVGDFFSIKRLGTTQLFFVCDRIDDKSLSVIELTSDTNAENMQIGEPLAKQTYVFNSNCLMDIVRCKQSQNENDLLATAERKSSKKRSDLARYFQKNCKTLLIDPLRKPEHNWIWLRYADDGKTVNYRFDVKPTADKRQSSSQFFAPEEEGFKLYEGNFDKEEKERRESSRKEDRDRKVWQQSE